jgi:hypothetical protein
MFTFFDFGDFIFINTKQQHQQQKEISTIILNKIVK